VSASGHLDTNFEVADYFWSDKIEAMLGWSVRKQFPCRMSIFVSGFVRTTAHNLLSALVFCVPGRLIICAPIALIGFVLFSFIIKVIIPNISSLKMHVLDFELCNNVNSKRSHSQASSVALQDVVNSIIMRTTISLE